MTTERGFIKGTVLSDEEKGGRKWYQLIPACMGLQCWGFYFSLIRLPSSTIFSIFQFPPIDEKFIGCQNFL